MSSPDLEGRLASIELGITALHREVRAARSQLADERAPVPPRPQPVAPRPAPAPKPPPRPVAPVRTSDDFEESVLGKWFPRAGALALLLGVGFAFKYAIDQGIIGPGLRVFLGVILGLALVAAGDATHRRGWQPYAYAVTGGGIAVVYLSIWAGYHLYGLITPAEALPILIAVTVGAAALAVRYDSVALALLATIGGFLNPVVAGRDLLGSEELLVYIAALDIGVVLLAHLRHWTILDRTAFTASWFLYSFGETDGTDGLVFASVLFLIFAAIPYLRSLGRRDLRFGDLLLAGLNPAAYYLAGVETLGYDDPAIARFTLVLALFHLGYAYGLDRMRSDRRLQAIAGGAGIALLTLYVPLEFGAAWVPGLWAIEGAGLLLAALMLARREVSLPGVGLLALSLASATIAFEDYEPTRFLVSAESASLVLQVLAFYGAGYVALVDRDLDPVWRRAAATIASGLTLLWMSLEARAAIAGPVPTPAQGRTVAFALSAIWGLYAAGLLSVGIVARLITARVVAIAVFGATLLKICLHDLWLVSPLHRVIAFIGIGCLLLACSLMYHRFKEMILGTSTAEPAVA
jgi:uncharacterized membrane protein